MIVVYILQSSVIKAFLIIKILKKDLAVTIKVNVVYILR